MGSRQSDSNNRTVATNRKARHKYAIDETFEAGLVLTGAEVKSVRGALVSIAEAWVEASDGELFLMGAHIKQYPWAHEEDYVPTRARKLLLKRAEVDRIRRKLAEKGFTAVPLRLYFRRGWAKVQVGLGKGKKLHDRREDIKERDAKREAQRAVRERGD